MSKKVDICDLCGKRWPEYKFKYKAVRWFSSFMDSWKETYDICDDCWKRLRKLAKKEQS